MYKTLVLGLSLLSALVGSLGAAPKLAHYNVDKSLLSVSGFSSGAFFAVQFHVAFSKSIMGAGIVAGGPFWCAQNQLDVAHSVCMESPDLIPVNKLVSFTYITALTGTIDPPSHMAKDRIFLFACALDTVVYPEAMKKLAEYYSSFVTTGDLYTLFSIPAEHAMVTDNYGGDCDTLKHPFINNCNYSVAYGILEHIYPDIKPADHSLAKPSNLQEFDQSEFFVDLPKTVSMDTTGFIYVPTNCQNKTTVCRLHTVFHGCLQGRVYISDVFALHAGYNALAELNDIIILYPQATNSTINPKGCWDWWDYLGSEYSCKLGPQMAGIKLMLDKIIY